TPLRLSEAIHLGSMLNPQGFGGLRTVTDRTTFQEATCALGGAFEAAGCDSHLEVDPPGARVFRASVARGARVRLIDMPPDWRPVLARPANCPECRQDGSLGQIIAHLNDRHRWTRTRIAELVQSLEQGDAFTRRGAAALRHFRWLRVFGARSR